MQGARSWFKDQGGNWQPCTAGKVNGQDGTQSFKGDNGEVNLTKRVLKICCLEQFAADLHNCGKQYR